MARKIDWKGVYPAVTTKFTDSDKLDFAAFEKNIVAQVEAGVDGIILGGSLGEASTLTIEEKDALLKFSVKTFGNDIPVLMNIAEQSTTAAADAARRAEDAGAGGLMLLPPMRYAADALETVTFLKRTAKATSLPIIIYNNPVDYKIEVTREMFSELLECDNIRAVKESTRDITNVTRLRNAFGKRLSILTGVDPLGMESLLMGADGWVAGLCCAFPRETVAIYRLIKANRIAEALVIHRWFLPLLELDVSAKLVQNIKLAEAATGLGNENVRAPRLKLYGEERIRVQKIISKAMAERVELPDYLHLTPAYDSQK